MSQAEKAKLKLTEAKYYYYLTQGRCLTCEGIDDREEFAIIRGSMKVRDIQEDLKRNHSPLISLITLTGIVTQTTLLFKLNSLFQNLRI